MADDDAALFCPLEFRYGRTKVRALFSRNARLTRALRVEAALAATEAELGMIPAEAARAIEAASKPEIVTVARVDALERELKHDVMAITRALAEAAGPAGRWVHYGATSADITDSALALELQESGAVLRTDLTDLARVLAALARTHRATAEVGRTHGQHGVPISFGYKMAVATAEVMRHRRRLDQLLPRLTVGKMAGAVGTGAGFGPHAVAVEQGVMRRLGITADEAPTQITGRDRIAEFTNWLALVAGTAERLATEVRNLQRTEIAEVAEPFDERRQVGSSTMAQKRNPMQSENVTSLARLVRAFALPPLENMVQWHERDLANSANERVVLPHSTLLTDDILTKLTEVFTGLRVDVARMGAEVDRSAGGSMTESLMLALTGRGLARADAHELLRRLTKDPGTGPSLAERAKADPTVREWLDPPEIDRLLDPAAYVRAAAEKTDRVLSVLDPELSG
ncbi:MAG: adenylosuccinate lyase [Thermoplasmata archaeon]